MDSSPTTVCQVHYFWVGLTVTVEPADTVKLLFYLNVGTQGVGEGGGVM